MATMRSLRQVESLSQLVIQRGFSARFLLSQLLTTHVDVAHIGVMLVRLSPLRY